MKENFPHFVVDMRDPNKVVEGAVQAICIPSMSSSSPSAPAVAVFRLKNPQGQGPSEVYFTVDPNDPRYADNEGEGVVDLPVKGGFVKLVAFAPELVKTADAGAALEASFIDLFEGQVPDFAALPFDVVVDIARKGCDDEWTGWPPDWEPS